MPDSSVTVNGNVIDTWEVGGEHRQVMITKSPSTATRTSVTASTSDVQLLSPGTRLKLCVFNDSTATLYLGFGSASASTTSFTCKIAAGGYFEYDFTGEVHGVWSAANGAARITEVTV